VDKATEIAIEHGILLILSAVMAVYMGYEKGLAKRLADERNAFIEGMRYAIDHFKGLER